MPARNHIDLVAKTVGVLEVLTENQDGADLRDIAARLGLVKSSVFRILYTLKELGYVDQAAGYGPYRLSRQVSALTRKPLAPPNFFAIAGPHLKQLRNETSESAWLARLRGGDLILIAVIHAQRRLQVTLDLGDACPLHATASGKAIAAHTPLADLNAALGAGVLPRFTSRTLIERGQLAAELAKVRQQGFAVNHGETAPAAVFVGAPVFDTAGKAFAAVSVSAPVAQCSADKWETMIRAVKRAAAAITQDLAHVRFTSGERLQPNQ